jgi:hypothetical protein
VAGLAVGDPQLTRRKDPVLDGPRVADPYPYPDSIGSVDPDSKSGSGSRRAKITHKSRQIFKVHVLK